MKTALIFLSSLAVALGLFAYFAVFGGSGTYAVNSMPGTIPIATGTVLILPTSTASSSSSIGGGNQSPSSTASTTDFYGSEFGTPPLSWTDGGANFLITAASLQNGRLSFTLTLRMGPSPSCVPINLRFVADESGDLQPPDTAAFSFPDSGTCNGAPGATYQNQTVSFTVDPTKLPFLFTTGGAPNIFFEVASTTSNGLRIDIPSTSG